MVSFCAHQAKQKRATLYMQLNQTSAASGFKRYRSFASRHAGGFKIIHPKVEKFLNAAYWYVSHRVQLKDIAHISRLT